MVSVHPALTHVWIFVVLNSSIINMRVPYVFFFTGITAIILPFLLWFSTYNFQSSHLLQYMCVHVHVQLHPTLCDPMDCSSPGSSVHGLFKAKNTGVGCHFLFQRIFQTQGLNLQILLWQADSFPLHLLGSPQSSHPAANVSTFASISFSSLDLLVLQFSFLCFLLTLSPY